MNKLKIAFILVAFLGLTGCGDKTIDASNEESTKASIESIKNTLTGDELKRFEKAIMLVGFSKVDLKNPKKMKSAMKAALDGKTANQIISEADVILANRKAKEKKQAEIEIKELLDKKEKSKLAALELTKLEVIKSRFYKKKAMYSKDPVIELTVKNNLDQAISRAYFKGVIASPNRSIPWLTETFNYNISGGLEPGEEANWKLSPNKFSKWGTVDVPEDAIFTVTVERLDGANKETILSSKGFTERNAKRLKKLQDNN